MEENPDGRGRFGKGTFGSCTAAIVDVQLPVRFIGHLKGVSEENPGPGQHKYDRLMQSFAEHGYTHEVEIIIWVNHLGQAWIAEGNNRVAVAKKMGVESVRATVYYFNGGEEVESGLSPTRVRSMVMLAPNDRDAMKSRIKPRVGYHTTDAKNDLSITSEGLRPDSRGNIYVWDSLEMARWFAGFSKGGEKMRVWEVSLSGLNLIPDPETQDMSEWTAEFDPGQDGGGWVIQGQEVGPDRLREY